MLLSLTNSHLLHEYLYKNSLEIAYFEVKKRDNEKMEK